MKVYIIDFDQDDPKKCTGKKLVRLGYGRFIKRPKGIILNPYSKRILSIEDKSIILRRGITVIDSSWKSSDETFFKRFYTNSRRLPFLLAGNPINYAKAYILSSLEAIVASFYIIDEIDLALEIASKIKWGMTFINLNRELLESYRGKSSEEILKIEREILNEREPQ
ncbi:MAG: DUF367 family protein [Sulfolobaceae archaeon]